MIDGQMGGAAPLKAVLVLLSVPLCPQSMSKWPGHPSLNPLEGAAQWNDTTHHLLTSTWTKGEHLTW